MTLTLKNMVGQDLPCKRCLKPQCRGNSIYDCCDIENPNWMMDWLYRMKQSQSKSKKESGFGLWYSKTLNK
jgi:hypothetical protein